MKILFAIAFSILISLSALGQNVRYYFTNSQFTLLPYSTGTNVFIGGTNSTAGQVLTSRGGTSLAWSNLPSSGISGTVINSGASTATQYPKYTDTTGTNVSPDTITLASADFANQGSSTTVLHGNAAGNPSWGAVALGTDVSGTLLAAQFPALTGDITTSAGSLATTLKNTGTAGTYTSVTTDAQGRVTSGSSPTATASLDQVTADVASAAINNAAFTNQWRWTDPGSGKKSFAIKSTNSTASTTFSLSGQMTSATANFFEMLETTASTSGAGLQDFAKITTLSGSTANPLSIFNQGTNVFTLYGPTGQLLMGPSGGNPDTTYPLYSFRLNNTYGFDLASGGYLIGVLAGTERARIDSTGLKTTGVGSASAPSYSFTTQTSSGLYSPFAGTAGLAGGGTLVAWATNSVFHSTNHWINLVPYTWPTAQGSSSTYLKNDGSGGLTWSSVASGASLDAVTADVASSSINNGAFTNQWYWTDPGASKNSFAIKGTNSTASTTLRLSGQMTSATAAFVKIDETTASTSGANSQYLLDVETLASSTANPLRVATRGTEVFRVDQTGSQILAADGTTTIPVYGFASRSTSGLLYSSGPRLQYDSSTYQRVINNQIDLNAGGNEMFEVSTGNGTSAMMENGTVIFNGGTSGNPGIAYRNRVIAKTADATLSQFVSNGTVVSGLVFNNHGASGTVIFTLPSAANTGVCYTFIVDAAQVLEVLATNSDKFQMNSSLSAANGNIQSSTVGNILTIVATANNRWYVTSHEGTWTVN